MDPRRQPQTCSLKPQPQPGHEIEFLNLVSNTFDDPAIYRGFWDAVIDCRDKSCFPATAYFLACCCCPALLFELLPNGAATLLFCNLALRVSYKKMNPFCVPFATTNMGSAMLAMDLVDSKYLFLSEMVMQDVMLCDGSDAAIIPTGGSFVACRALSQRNSDPAKASHLGIFLQFFDRKAMIFRWEILPSFFVKFKDKLHHN